MGRQGQNPKPRQQWPSDPPGAFAFQLLWTLMSATESMPHNPPGRKRLVAMTPTGSTIEALEDGHYRVCLPQGPCQTVMGLHRANDLLYWSEQTRAHKTVVEG